MISREALGDYTPARAERAESLIALTEINGSPQITRRDSDFVNASSECYIVEIKLKAATVDYTRPEGESYG